MKCVDQKSSIAFYSPEYCEGGDHFNMEMDQESNGSSSTEDVESPRSVAVERLRRRRNKVMHAHNQVAKIKTEDSNLGEDRFVVAHFMIYSRPVLPASPLSGKTTC